MAVDDWSVDGHPMKRMREERTYWDRIELVYDARQTRVEDVFDRFGRANGEYQQLTLSNGSLKTKGRAGGANEFDLDNPLARSTLHDDGLYYADTYSTRQTDQQRDTARVRVTLMRPETKHKDEDLTATDNYSDDAQAAGQWHFDFADGSVATKGVIYPTTSDTTSSTGSTARMELYLDQREAAVLEGNASRLSAVREREVPDGENVLEDNSPDKRNTVTVRDPPSADIITSGEYVIQSWEGEWINNDEYRYTVTAGLVEEKTGGGGGDEGMCPEDHGQTRTGVTGAYGVVVEYDGDRSSLSAQIDDRSSGYTRARVWERDTSSFNERGELLDTADIASRGNRTWIDFDVAPEGGVEYVVALDAEGSSWAAGYGAGNNFPLCSSGNCIVDDHGAGGSGTDRTYAVDCFRSSSDRPTVTNVDPCGDTEADTLPAVSVAFDEPVSASGAGAFRLVDTGSGDVFESFGVSDFTVSGNTVSFAPSDELDHDTTYRAEGDAGVVEDADGNGWGGSHSCTFTTEKGGGGVDPVLPECVRDAEGDYGQTASLNCEAGGLVVDITGCTADYTTAVLSEIDGAGNETQLVSESTAADSVVLDPPGALDPAERYAVYLNGAGNSRGGLWDTAFGSFDTIPDELDGDLVEVDGGWEDGSPHESNLYAFGHVAARSATRPGVSNCVYTDPLNYEWQMNTAVELSGDADKGARLVRQSDGEVFAAFSADGAGDGTVSVTGSDSRVVEINLDASASPDADGSEYCWEVDNGFLTTRCGTDGLAFECCHTIEAGTPSVEAFDPEDGSAGVPTTKTLVATFDQPMAFGFSGSFYVRESDGTLHDEVPVDDVLIFDRDVKLEVSGLSSCTGYHVTADAGVVEAEDSGAAWPGISSANTWNFRSAGCDNGCPDPPCKPPDDPCSNGDECQGCLDCINGTCQEVGDCAVSGCPTGCKCVDGECVEKGPGDECSGPDDCSGCLDCVDGECREVDDCGGEDTNCPDGCVCEDGNCVDKDDAECMEITGYQPPPGAESVSDDLFTGYVEFGQDVRIANPDDIQIGAGGFSTTLSANGRRAEFGLPDMDTCTEYSVFIGGGAIEKADGSCAVGSLSWSWATGDENGEACGGGPGDQTTDEVIDDFQDKEINSDPVGQEPTSVEWSSDWSDGGDGVPN